ncbi:MAG: hypothetical protein WBA45_06705 [Microthrixaceae bacterium]
MRKILGGLVAAMLATGLLVTTAGPASAAACKLYNGTTATKASTGNWYSQAFTTPTGGCNDTNLYLTSYSNYYKGQYLSGGTWTDGAAGWKLVPANTPSYGSGRVLISSVTDGTPVRVTEYQHGGSAVTVGL